MSIIDLAKKIAKHFEGMENLYLMRKCQMQQRKKSRGTFMEDEFNWSPQMNIDDGIKATKGMKTYD